MVEPWSGSNAVFHLVVTESNIPYTWYNLTEVNHVCRTMVPNANGTPLDFTSTNQITLNLSFNMQNWILANCELVGFVQTNTDKEVLQGSYTPLMFLQPPPPPLAPGFSADVTELCETNDVQFTDESVGNPDSWYWEFEGGTPETSTEEDPLVTYETPGVYDVTLTVSKSGDDTTSTRSDYITVYAYPDQPTIEQVEQTIVSSAEEGNQWYLEGEAIPGATNQVYTPEESGNYTVVVTVNDCSSESEEFYFSMIGIDELANIQSMRIFPSPNNGQFTIYLNTGDQQSLNMKLYNTSKSLVYQEENIQVDGTLQKRMDVGNLPNGIYFMVIEGNETYIEKVVIQK
jgi:PKD repeat protein